MQGRLNTGFNGERERGTGRVKEGGDRDFEGVNCNTYKALAAGDIEDAILFCCESDSYQIA